MGDYRSLKVWQKAHRLTLQVYEITGSFPICERYGLISQMRRAASSVPMNIAEGAGRNRPAELAHFCRISLGSANEIDYQLLLARDLGYLEADAYAQLIVQVDEVRRMLSGLVSKLNQSQS
jgi:four helix bundle protein